MIGNDAVQNLVGAALLIRTFVALRAVDPGFDRHNILTMAMSVSGSRFEKTSDVNRLLRDGLQRVEALPGVVRAAAAYSLPLEGHFGIPFNIVGRAPGSSPYDGRGWMRPLDPGKGYGPEFEEPARQIVGVVGDVHDFGLNRNPQPVVYVPIAQVRDGITALMARALRIVWIVRTRGAPRSLAGAIERELREASGDLPVAQIRTMDEVVGQSTAREDFNMTLLTVFGCAALLLAAIGIYGLMAYAVEQRRQELAIRMALGAVTVNVRNMIVWQGMRLALAEVAVGVAAAFGLTRLLENFLFGVKAWDALVLVSVPGC